MSRYVTVRLRVRRDLAEAVTRYWFDEQPPPMPQGAYSGINEMAEALRAALCSPPRRPRKVGTPREETARIREALERRANGRCEACGAHFSRADPPEDDHILGRARARGEDAEWLIHRSCHRAKTENKPTAAHWLRLALDHCLRYGYEKTARALNARLEGIITIREEEKKGRAAT